MLNRQTKAAVAGLAASAAALIAAPPAHAAPAGAPPAEPSASRLVLAWTYEDGSDGSKVTLRCHPSGGSHPERSEACDALTEAGGHFEMLRSTGEPCTMQYRPVEVTATGHWFKRPVDYRETFGNLCTAKVETDRVFDF
ncbi:SSI family serine proteinase inhibitor [Nocardiopsis halophila]|uniref:SSI family serine proteinase inhibitor n=1 Tax=Nocardiopsis halophila TaxID=141692 RepID=UPI0003477922|nr:SSI family serine proteinase inhibitor [Nocardiopsis halophila]